MAVNARTSAPHAWDRQNEEVSPVGPSRSRLPRFLDPRHHRSRMTSSAVAGVVRAIPTALRPQRGPRKPSPVRMVDTNVLVRAYR
jgi:hypothetical protein